MVASIQQELAAFFLAICSKSGIFCRDVFGVRAPFFFGGKEEMGRNAGTGGARF